MNEVFIIGKVASEVEFKFIVNSKKYFSKVEFKIELNKQNIKIKGYNNIADFCYKSLKRNYNVFVNGKIDSNMNIIIKHIKIF